MNTSDRKTVQDALDYWDKQADYAKKKKLFNLLDGALHQIHELNLLLDSAEITDSRRGVRARTLSGYIFNDHDIGFGNYNGISMSYDRMAEWLIDHFDDIKRIVEG